jgi:hypothetical protein
MGRVYEKFVGTYLGGSINVSKAVPLDVKTVVQSITDLTSDELLVSVYEGLVVYVVDEKSLYVCHSKPEDDYLDNVEDGWKKVDVDYSVRIVESESNLTDGVTIKFPYQGMMAYVTSESALYILLTKGISKATDINNWKKISLVSSTPSIDKVGIDVAPEGGSGFKITGNKGVVIDDYVNVENYIRAKYAYTSKGINAFDPNPYFTQYESVKLTKKDCDGYIELYANGDNWIMIHDPNSLGLSVNVDGQDYVSDTLISKETPVCFGVDIKFHEGWVISYGNGTRDFTSNDYELIDIYRSEYSPEVYAYRNDIDVRILTEDDLVNNSLAHSIMIDVDGESDGSDNLDPMPLQKVIVNMNNAITKLEQTKVDPETIEHSEIDKLFS